MSANNHILSSHAYNLVSQAMKTVVGNYLEIGVFNGAGFAQVAKDNPTRICHAVDPFIEDGHTVTSSGQARGDALSSQHQSTLEHTKDLPNVYLHVMTSNQFRAELTLESAQQLGVGIVLIDGNHHYDFVVNDALLAVDLLGKHGGVVIFDDTDVPDVARAFKEFMDRCGSGATQIGTEDGAASIQIRGMQ